MRTCLIVFSFIICVASCSNQDSKKGNATKACKPAFFDTMTGKHVYRTVEIMPTFPDSNMDIHTYIEEKLNHVEVLDDDLLFTILLQFVVDVDGSIIGERAFFRSNTSKGTRTQELRRKELQYLQVVRDMPNWNIGRCGGEPVPVILSVPLRVIVSE